MAYFYMFRQLWRYSGKYYWRILIYYICHTISLLGVLGQPYVLSKICVVLQLREPSLMRDILFWLAIYVGLFFVFNMFHRIGRFMEQRISFRARQNFINDAYEKILSLPMEWHNYNHSGNTISRVRKAADALFDFADKQFQYVEYFVMFWGPLIALLLISWQISCLAFFMSLVIIYVIERFDKIIVQLFQQESETQHKFFATFFDYISNVKTIITLRVFQQTKQVLNEKIEIAYPILLKSVIHNQYKWFVVSFLILVLEVSVIFYFIQLNKTEISPIMIGAVVAIFQYIQQLGKMFFNITASFQEIVQFKTNFDSIAPIKSAYLYFKDRVSCLDAGKPFFWKIIKIKNLSFSYKESQKNILENIDLELSDHGKIALVGESGSGKSTLLSLLRGLYPVHLDHLFFNNHDYQDLSILSSITTLIQQESEVFENTIGYNISLGIKVSEKEIQEAMQDACFDVVFKNLPDGLDTDIREKGVNLSGGERQRLALARGLLAARSSAILLLDEPTSSVDVRNESMIYENIFKKFKNRCVVSSVHRLHLLDKFDLVYVMAHGQIVQKGTFEELKQQKGIFAELWKKYINESEI